MKHIYTLLIIMGISCKLLDGQVLNQDADGKSTLIYSGGTLGFDVGKTEVSFSFNNHYAPVTALDNKPKFLWGIGAKGKTDNGIAELFSGGHFLPSAEVNGLIGFKWDDAISTNRTNTHQGEIHWRSSYDELDRLRQDRKDLDDTYDTFVKSQTTLLSSTGNIDNAYKNDIWNNRGDLTNITTHLDSKINDAATTQADKNILTAIKTTAKKYSDDLDALDDEANSLYSARDSEFNQKRFIRNLFYLSSSVKGTGFDFYRDTTGSFFNYFGKKTAINWSAMVGYNHQEGRWLWGGAVGAEGISNLTDLKTKDYTITTTDTFSNQTLTTVTKKTAYRLDQYFTYIRINIFADAAYFMPIKGGDNGSIIWNAYIRLYAPVKEPKVQTTMNVGISAYFLDNKGKFTGGVYGQVNDAWDARATTVPNIPWYEKLSFGLIVRYNFAALASYK